MWLPCSKSNKFATFKPIKDFDRGKAFLAGPGPMHSTVSDFWTMIWEKKSHVIVMLGCLKESEMVNW